jgi:hypothetical protein
VPPPALFLSPDQVDEQQLAAERERARVEREQADLDALARDNEARTRRERNLAEFQAGEAKRAARAAKRAGQPEQPRPEHPSPEDGAALTGLPVAELAALIDTTLAAYETPGAASPSKRAFANLLRAARPHLGEPR